MELNTCSRCGAFYTTNSNVCPNCETQERLELSRLKDFLSENNIPTTSIEQIACCTGISEKNVSRFLSQNEFNI